MAPGLSLPATLELSAVERAEYALLVDRLVDATYADYTTFRDTHNRMLDVTRWREVKRVGDFAVYKERHATTDQCQTLLTADGLREPVVTSTPTPEMRVTGTLPGTVQDLIYAAFIDSSAAHRLRSAYLKDQATDFQFLAEVDGPTAQDPLRFSGLAWTEIADQGMFPFVWRRDLLVQVSMGIRDFGRSDNGLGYYVIHSVSRHEVRPFTDAKLKRAKCSFCFLFRQDGPDRVEVYQKGFFAAMGDVPERSVQAAVLKNVLVPTRLMDASVSKKLYFMMNHAPNRKRSIVRSQSCAAGCTTKFSHRHGACIICRLSVCGSCKIVKKIAVEATRYAVTERSLTFCLVCVNKAKTLDAIIFARSELQEKLAAEDEMEAEDEADHDYHNDRERALYEPRSVSSTRSEDLPDSYSTASMRSTRSASGAYSYHARRHGSTATSRSEPMLMSSRAADFGRSDTAGSTGSVRSTHSATSYEPRYTLARSVDYHLSSGGYNNQRHDRHNSYGSQQRPIGMLV